MNFTNLTIKKYFCSYFFAGIFLIFLAVLLNGFFSLQNKDVNITKKFTSVLHEKEKLLSDEIEKTKGVSFQQKRETRIRLESEFQKLYEKNGISIFVYEKDSLVYWSTNSVFGAEILSDRLIQNTSYFEKQRNGLYEIIRKQYGAKIIIGEILIKQQYPFENEYLKNNFGKGFILPKGANIDPSLGKNKIFNKDGKFLFTLILPYKKDLPLLSIIVLFFLYLTGFILLLISLFRSYCKFNEFFHTRWLFILSFCIDIILLRVLQFYFRFPKVLYNSNLFGSGLVNPSFLHPSFGDFLVNSFLILFISTIIFKYYPGFLKIQNKKRPIRLFVAISLFLFLVSTFLLCIVFISDLLLRSKIPLNLQDFSSLNTLSIIGFLIISAILLSFFLIGLRVIQSILNLMGLRDPGIENRKKRSDISLSRIVLYLIFFSVIVTLVINHYSDLIEKEQRITLALNLGNQRDAKAEAAFQNVEHNILKDTILKKIIFDTTWQILNETEDSLEHYLKRTFFNGYWHNYTLQTTICSETKMLRVQPENDLINCKDYFNNILNEVGKPTNSKHLYFMDYGYGYKNYLALFTFTKCIGRLQSKKNVYLEISSTLLYKDKGYPGLLIDKSEEQFPELSDYSYAYYRTGKLIHRVGNIPYKLELDTDITHHNGPAYFYSQKGYNHYCYPIDKSNVLIVSKKESSTLDKIAPFSYLFFFFSFFSILFFLITQFPDLLQISFLKLSDRLQLSMVGILASSLLIIGGLIVYYIFSLNTSKNLENLNERTHSLLIELQHKFGNSTNFDDLSKEEKNEMMTTFSNIFFVDVNLYSPKGRLIATSRPEIFEQSLSSELMNRQAFFQLSLLQNSYFVQEEKIGENIYNSAYIPFFNDRNELQAYLNLPYFARQDDLKKEISAFLVTFVNVYVLLIITGVFLTLVVSNYISRPLRILASRLSNLSYGRINDKINWKHRDEIGQLVNEYNRMLDELVRSADLIAKSERETAWREMAKQVAHEIKNPLTPMKLSVQHLEKAWKDNTLDWEERLSRFTETMIEQIETLSEIASGFSDFAQMPVTILESIDINEMLENVKTLYRETSNIHFEFYYDPLLPHNILGDRKQLLRVFSNLINNSIQAIGNKKEGKISVELKTVGTKYQVTIFDNGGGISAELTNRIFQPNFTTKSGGMGLGLAIVKSIIEGLRGEIGFESKDGVGTSFIFVFPALKPIIQEKK